VMSLFMPFAELPEELPPQHLLLHNRIAVHPHLFLVHPEGRMAGKHR